MVVDQLLQSNTAMLSSSQHVGGTTDADWLASIFQDATSCCTAQQHQQQQQQQQQQPVSLSDPVPQLEDALKFGNDCFALEQFFSLDKPSSEVISSSYNPSLSGEGAASESTGGATGKRKRCDPSVSQDTAETLEWGGFEWSRSLLELPTKDFCAYLKTNALTPPQVVSIKRCRRLLKGRTYAQRAHYKRRARQSNLMTHQQQLEYEKRGLQEQLEALKRDNDRLRERCEHLEKIVGDDCAISSPHILLQE